MLRIPSYRKEGHSAGGFSLVELLVGVVVLAISASMAGILIGVSNRSTIGSQQAADASAAIESNVARIRASAESYTCCSGTCTVTPTSSATCVGAVGDSSYYFPQTSANVTAFETLCTSGTLTTALRQAIDAIPQPANVTRSAAVQEDSSAHRLRIAFAGPAGVNKTVTIVPTVAGWCP